MRVYALDITHVFQQTLLLSVAHYHLFVNFISYVHVNSPKDFHDVCGVCVLGFFFSVTDINDLELSFKISNCTNGCCHDEYLIGDCVVKESTTIKQLITQIHPGRAWNIKKIPVKENLSFTDSSGITCVADH